MNEFVIRLTFEFTGFIILLRGEDMAEKINIPPKFTKEWFSYIWSYYKVHIMVGIAVLLLVIYTIHDFSTIVDYDIKLATLTKDVIMSEEMQAELAEKMEEVTGDINENESADALVTHLSFSDSMMQDSQMMVALESKLMTMLISEDEMLYLCDEAMVKRLLSMKTNDDAFVPVKKWAGDIAEKELGYEYGDGIFAASLKESQLLKDTGLDTEKLYIMVKINMDADDAENSKRFEASCDFAKKVIK